MPRKNADDGEIGSVMWLCDVAIGQKAKIAELALPSAEQEYLMRLGFVPGAEVEVVRKAPLQGPLIYRVYGTEVAIRSDTARCIRVESRSAEGARAE